VNFAIFYFYFIPLELFYILNFRVFIYQFFSAPLKKISSEDVDVTALVNKFGANILIFLQIF